MGKDAKRVLLVAKESCERSRRFLEDRIAGTLWRIDRSLYVDTMQTSKRLDPYGYDLMIVAGGDGTMLRASSLFPSLDTAPPPILPFSLGTLGFLLPFPTPRISKTRGLEARLQRALQFKLPMVDRERLLVEEEAGHGQYSALNEVCLHRGHRPRMIRMQCSLGSALLTEAVADGMLVSTPTGSSAYALSAGGPLVHPQVPGLLLTAVCPQALSFRPLLLPLHSDIHLRLVEKKQSNGATLSIDGVVVDEAFSADTPLSIRRHPQPLRVLHRTPDLNDEWARKLSSSLSWSASLTR
jgi:NADH kinase